MNIGSLRLDPVFDGGATVPAKSMLRRETPDGDEWAAHRQFLTDDGKLELTIGGFLVRGNGRTVLIDAGVGNFDNGTFKGGALLDSLAVLGVAPDEVTDVVFTHLHFDHVGWATSKGVVVFERATYRCHDHDWAHFVASPDAEAGAVRKLSPLESRLETFSDNGSLLPGIDVRHAPGHTPGSAVVVVSDAGERAVLLGDAVHCPVELMEDDWQMMYDVDQALAARTREALARELEGTDVPIAAAHFPGMRFGRLLPGQGRRLWQFDARSS
jgi:glyoxylase-like metal-dependent hydrolase (beta-lactamase superfamily II)